MLICSAPPWSISTRPIRHPAAIPPPHHRAAVRRSLPRPRLRTDPVMTDTESDWYWADRDTPERLGRPCRRWQHCQGRGRTAGATSCETATRPPVDRRLDPGDGEAAGGRRDTVHLHLETGRDGRGGRDGTDGMGWDGQDGTGRNATGRDGTRRDGTEQDGKGWEVGGMEQLYGSPTRLGDCRRVTVRLARPHS